jgi:hypothetical protein
MTPVMNTGATLLLGCAMACAEEAPGEGALMLNDSVLDHHSVLWLETNAAQEGWGRAVLMITDEDRTCADLPKQAPGLRALYRSSPLQGEGSGLLVWLQWTDLDEKTRDWEGRFVFGEAPVGDRLQRRAVQIPFEEGGPILDQPGRHGSIDILSVSTTQISGELGSESAKGLFTAQRCSS